MFWPIPFLELYHSKGTTPYANFTIGFDKLPDRRIDVGETERHRIAPRVFEGAGITVACETSMNSGAQLFYYNGFTNAISNGCSSSGVVPMTV
jgi:hypothetical protein